MTSQIDITKPEYGSATTQSVRDNFTFAHNEITQLQSDVAGKLPMTGGTLGGPLILNADPTAPLGAATKQYIDGKTASVVSSFNTRSGTVTFTSADLVSVNGMLSTGTTMTGVLTLAADPAAPLSAATKQYVDAMAGTGGSGSGVSSFNTRIGVVTLLSTDLSSANGLLTTGGALTGGLNWGSAYAANDGDNSRHISLYGGNQYGINVTAGRFNHNSPTAHAFRVANADVVTIDTNGLNLPAANPTANTQAAHKAYVDTKAPVANPTFTAGVFETRVAMAANNIDLNTGVVFTKTISGATTLTVSNAPASGIVASFILDLTNGGSSTITWWANIRWPGAIAPTLTASGRDLLGFITHDSGVNWNGILLGKDMR